MAWYDPFDDPVVGVETAVTTGTTHDMAVPAGTQAGDIVHIFAGRYSGSPTLSMSSTGWTDIGAASASSGRLRGIARVFDGSEGATVPLVLNTVIRKILVCVSLRLVNPSIQGVDEADGELTSTSPSVLTVAGGGTNPVPNQVLYYPWGGTWDPTTDPTQTLTPDADVELLASRAFDDSGIGGGSGFVNVYARIEGDSTFDAEEFTQTFDPVALGTTVHMVGRWETRGTPPTLGQDHWSWAEAEAETGWDG